MIEFRELNKEEETEFKMWARENYSIGEEIRSVWHPIIQNECMLMNVEWFV